VERALPTVAAWELDPYVARRWPLYGCFPECWYEHGLAELRLHLQNVGVMGADLINFALIANRLYETGGGTGTYANYLVNTSPFEPASPGQVGAIALRPYQGPQDDGSIALYVGPHKVIQSIPGRGVTDQFTDKQMYSRPEPRYHFTIYGFLRGVRY